MIGLGAAALDRGEPGLAPSDEHLVGDLGNWPGDGASSALRFAISNITALHLPVGETIANHLAKRLPISSALHWRISVVLQEAVLNAVIHGNLAISSPDRIGAADHFQLQCEIDRRLTDPLLQAKTCKIRVRWPPGWILIRVSDQGEGFAPGTAYDPALPWGRGIKIMQALATSCRWMDRGRQVAIRFAR